MPNVLKNTADAIRRKTQKTGLLKVGDFAAEIDRLAGKGQLIGEDGQLKNITKFENQIEASGRTINDYISTYNNPEIMRRYVKIGANEYMDTMAPLDWRRYDLNLGQIVFKTTAISNGPKIAIKSTFEHNSKIYIAYTEFGNLHICDHDSKPLGTTVAISPARDTGPWVARSFEKMGLIHLAADVEVVTLDATGKLLSKKEISSGETERHMTVLKNGDILTTDSNKLKRLRYKNGAWEAIFEVIPPSTFGGSCSDEYDVISDSEGYCILPSNPNHDIRVSLEGTVSNTAYKAWRGDVDAGQYYFYRKDDATYKAKIKDDTEAEEVTPAGQYLCTTFNPNTPVGRAIASDNGLSYFIITFKKNNSNYKIELFPQALGKPAIQYDPYITQSRIGFCFSSNMKKLTLTVAKENMEYIYCMDIAWNSVYVCN